jgi:hypothetical protein
MLMRAIAVAAIALPLAAFAGDERSAGGTTDSNEGKPRTGKMDDSTPGHGHAAGALGNSSDTTGATGAGGAGSRAGTEGAGSPTGAGETGGAASGRWDEGGGKTAGEAGGGAAASGGAGGAAGATGHAGDKTVTGKLSKISDDSVTIESGKGQRHELKIVGQTMIRMDGKDASRSQLKEGQEVRASFAEHGGQQVAVRIDAGRAEKGGGASSAGAKPQPGVSSGSSTETKKSK